MHISHDSCDMRVQYTKYNYQNKSSISQSQSNLSIRASECDPNKLLENIHSWHCHWGIPFRVTSQPFFFCSFCIRWFMYIRGFEHRKRQIKKKSKTLSAFANFAVKWQLRAVDRLSNYRLTNITYIAFRCNAPDNNNNKVIKVHNIHSKKWPATVQQLKRSMMMHLNRQHEPIVYSLCMWNTLNYVTIHGARATATDARVVHSISGRRLHFHSLLVLLLLLLLVFVCCITKMKVWIFWIEYVVLW